MNPSGIIYIFKEPIFTQEQFDRLSNILDNAGNVFLAVGVVGPLFGSIDSLSLPAILVGVLTTLSLWVGSMIFAKKTKTYD